MKKFNNGFERFCSKRNVSQELKTLLSSVYNQIHSSKVNLELLKESLTNLFLFLDKAENCTNSNCKTVDLFFCIEDHWNKKWDDLPEDYQHILNDIGGCLHDTISNSDIAKNFESTPKQLLERIKKLNEENIR